MSVPDWAQKMPCIIVLNRRTVPPRSFREFICDDYCRDHGLSGSCTKEMHVVRKLSVWYKIPIWFQNTVCRKLKTLFKKYKLELTTGIHTCIGHVLRNYKDTATADGHENVSWKSEFTFFQSLTRLLCQMQANSSGAEFVSTISKFMKAMNFVTACLRPSQNVKLGIFKGSRAVDGKEMYKKAWCTCKVVVLSCQAIAYLTFSSRRHLKLPIIYDTLWSVKNRIYRGKLKCSCL